MANQLTRYATVATVDTAEEGYWWGLTAWGGAVSAASPIAADIVRGLQFVLGYRLVVGRLSLEITTLSVGGSIGVGIYSADGQTRLITSAAISTTTTGVKTAILAAAVTLEPGTYWFAWTADNTTVNTANISRPIQAGNILNARTTKKFVVAGNGPDSPGVLPSALGTLTTAVGAAIVTPLTIFEP